MSFKLTMREAEAIAIATESVMEITKRNPQRFPAGLKLWFYRYSLQVKEQFDEFMKIKQEYLSKYKLVLNPQTGFKEFSSAEDKLSFDEEMKDSYSQTIEVLLDKITVDELSSTDIDLQIMLMLSPILVEKQVNKEP